MRDLGIYLVHVQPVMEQLQILISILTMIPIHDHTNSFSELKGGLPSSLVIRSFSKYFIIAKWLALSMAILLCELLWPTPEACSMRFSHCAFPFLVLQFIKNFYILPNLRWTYITYNKRNQLNLVLIYLM